MEQLRKISTKSVGLDEQTVESVCSKSKRPVPVLRVYGIVEEAIAGSSTYGEYIRFKGKFEAINIITDQVFRSTSVILPAIASEVINDLYNAAKEKDSSCSVEIGVDITAIYRDNPKGSKYEWGVSSLTKPQGKDSLALLGERFGALPKMIEEKVASKNTK